MVMQVSLLVLFFNFVCLCFSNMSSSFLISLDPFIVQSSHCLRGNMGKYVYSAFIVLAQILVFLFITSFPCSS